MLTAIDLQIHRQNMHDLKYKACFAQTIFNYNTIYTTRHLQRKTDNLQTRAKPAPKLPTLLRLLPKDIARIHRRDMGLVVSDHVLGIRDDRLPYIIHS